MTAGSSVSVQDKAGWTPIDWAAFRADRAFVDLILRFTSGALIKGPGRGELSGYHPEAFSPLFLAAAAGDDQSIETMLKFGLQTSISTDQNVGRLFMVLSKGSPESRYFGGQNHTSMPSLVNSSDFSVKLLELAIRSNHLTIVKTLVELGASLGAVDSEVKKRTPLHIAACCGHQQICEYLLFKGASPAVPDADGHTAMDLAIMVGHPQCTRLFLALSPPPSTFLECGIALTAFVLGLKGAGPGKLLSSTPTQGEAERCDPKLPAKALPMPVLTSMPAAIFLLTRAQGPKR